MVVGMKFLSIGDQVRPGRYSVWGRFPNSVILFSADGRALFMVADRKSVV